MAVIFKDYTLSLDEAYDAYAAGSAQAEPETAAPVGTAEAPAQGEGGEPAPSQIPVIAAPETAQGEQQPAGEPAAEQPASEEASAQPAPAAEQPKKESNPTNVRRMTALILLAALLVILILGAVIRPILRKKRKEQDLEY